MRSPEFDKAAKVMYSMCQQEYLPPQGYAAFDLDLNCLGWFKDLDGAWESGKPEPIVAKLPFITDDDPPGQCRGHLAAALIFEVETAPWNITESSLENYEARLSKCCRHLGEAPCPA